MTKTSAVKTFEQMSTISKRRKRYDVDDNDGSTSSPETVDF
jgi:hypothetical protein